MFNFNFFNSKISFHGGNFKLAKPEFSIGKDMENPLPAFLRMKKIKRFWIQIQWNYSRGKLHLLCLMNFRACGAKSNSENIIGQILKGLNKTFRSVLAKVRMGLKYRMTES